VTSPVIQRAQRRDVPTERAALHPQRVPVVGAPPELERLDVSRRRLVPPHAPGQQEIQPHPDDPGVLAVGCIRPRGHPPRGEKRVEPRIRTPVRIDQQRLTRPAVIAPKPGRDVTEWLQNRTPHPRPRRTDIVEEAVPQPQRRSSLSHEDPTLIGPPRYAYAKFDNRRTGTIMKQPIEWLARAMRE